MISVIGHSGLGNILFYVANGLYQAILHNEQVELIFIDLEKNTVITDGRKEILEKTYQPYGGHPYPEYFLETAFPNLTVKYNVDIDEYSKGRTIYHEPHHYSPDCIYNIGKWNYAFLSRKQQVKELLDFSYFSAIGILSKHGEHDIDFSLPCVHLRLGSIGDNKAPFTDYLKNVFDYTDRLSKFYVISENAQAAKEFINSPRAIVIDEPCSVSCLYLLSRFKELLLSRSTLSMWGAYLSDAKVNVLKNFEDDWHKVNPEWHLI